MGRRLYFGFGLPLGRPRCEAEDDLAAVAKNKFDGRQRLADAGVVEDLGAVFGERHVEINADQHMLVLQLIGPRSGCGWKNVHDGSLAFCAIENRVGFDLDAP